MTRRVAGHAYPWDVAGDPAFVERVLELGLEEVTLAAAYHSVRAATPMHPRHQVVEAAHAALYRPVRAEAWAGRRLQPFPASWMVDDDSFATGARELRKAGLRVNAWIVLNHNTRLGHAVPDVVVVNCFGDRYPYALCPQHDEVREFAATLTAESLHDLDVEGVSLEAWGQLGVKHAGQHDKTADAWSLPAEQLLSVCCCVACRRAWTTLGLDAEHVVDQLRDAVIALRHGDSSAELSEGVADALLATRHRCMTDTLSVVLGAARDAAPDARLTAHAHPDPWSGVPLDCVVRASGDRVAAVLVPTWPTTAASAALISAAARLVPDGMAVGAYVTALPPANVDELGAHVRRILEEGADELHLYHLGLAGVERQRALATLTRS